MKLMGLIAVCLLMQLTPDVAGIEAMAAPAAEETANGAEAGTVSGSEGIAALATVEIPDVTGLSEEEAVDLLEAFTLSDGSKLEIIKTYEYSAETEADTVLVQEPVGRVGIEDAAQVFLTVSLGQEPAEVLSGGSQEVSALSAFGLAAAPAANFTESRLGIDWASLPSSYEYNWDNSSNCWYYGVWVDGECYKTPEGTYSTDVRHKMQLYCDGAYVYLHVIISRDYGSKFNGEDYQFWIDGQMAAFQVEYVGGGIITGNTGNLAPGTYQVEVRHRNSSMSYEVVPDSLAYLTKYENDINAEVELRIPLSELQRQNPNIDLDNIGTIEFFTPNLMYRRITASGADTMPLATAGAAFLLIPGSTVLIRRKWKKKEKEASK